MAEFPFLPLWVDAYLSDTVDLTPEQHGIYLLLLMLAWRRADCSIPADTEYLRSWFRHQTGMHGNKFNAVVPPILERFFMRIDGDFVQKRLRKERDFVEKKSRKARENAQKRWVDRKENSSLTDATAMLQKCDRDASTPTPTPINKQDNNYGASRRSSLSFEGRIIRLNDTDYRRWKESFPEIDLDGALAALDAHYDTDLTGDDRKKWFKRCAGALANKNQEALERRQSADGDGYDPDIIH